MLLGVSKVSGPESETARVWNIHIYKNTSKSIFNIEAVWVWDVGIDDWW